MAYCDFCTCRDCQFGTKYLNRAQTTDGRWICDVCYTYDLCTSGPTRNPKGPCEDKNCRHRPTLITGWM